MKSFTFLTLTSQLSTNLIHVSRSNSSITLNLKFCSLDDQRETYYCKTLGFKARYCKTVVMLYWSNTQCCTERSIFSIYSGKQIVRVIWRFRVRLAKFDAHNHAKQNEWQSLYYRDLKFKWESSCAIYDFIVGFSFSSIRFINKRNKRCAIITIQINQSFK